MKQITANETKTTTGKKGGWAKLDRAVIEDTTLCKTAIALYGLLREMVDFDTNITYPVSYSTLGKKLGRSARTACTHMRTIIDKGIVIPIPHFTIRNGKKVYGKNSYHVIGGDAPCYQHPESTNPFTSPYEEKTKNFIGGYEENCETNTPDYYDSDSSTKETNTTWEAETSSVALLSSEVPTEQYVNPEAPKVPETTTETPSRAGEEATAKELSARQKTGSSTPATKKPETAPKELDLSNVPDKLRPTAILILTLSERTKLKEEEVKLLLKLLKKHYPNRIEREFERQARRFNEEGTNPHCLQVFLIYEILKNQRSRPYPKDEIPVAPVAAETPADTLTNPRTAAIFEAVNPPAKKKRTRGNKKAVTRTPNIDSAVQSDNAVQCEPVGLVMPVAEAEKVIADYEAEHAKPVEPAPAIPAALEELFAKMEKREAERCDEFSAALPRNEYGIVWPVNNDSECQLTLEDYLHLKYPEAEEEELCRDYSGQVYGSVSEHSEIGRIKAAFEIDYACYDCSSPEECQLPKGCRKGQPKLETKMFTGKDGKRFLGAGFEGCIKCKHNRPKPKEKTPEEKRREANFEYMMSRSGILRKDKTFETYKAGVPELIVAEAMAILAAKTGRNLVLAGRAGTGKTHLATAIAIDAMKAGRQARVVTACEMLDEICQAYRNNTDPFGVLLKYKSVPVLVIDDWDKAKMSDARLDYLYQIINSRYTKGLQTIVTMNAYDMNGIVLPKWCKGSIEPIMSRLLENGDWVTIREADNYRLKRSAPVASVRPVEFIPEPEVEPVLDKVVEAEALAEIEQITVEMASPEYKLLEEAQAELNAELEAKYCTVQQSEPEAPEPEDTVPLEVDRSGKISLTEQPEVLDEQEPEFVPDIETIPVVEVTEQEPEPIEIKLSCEEIASMSKEEWDYYCAEQRRKQEQRTKKAPEPKPPVKSWQEISQSPEYQALSESEKLKRQWEYFRETPEYQNMYPNDKASAQLGFVRRIREAELRECFVPAPMAEPAKQTERPVSKEPPIEQRGQQPESPNPAEPTEEWKAFAEEWDMLKKQDANLNAWLYNVGDTML